eukprot:TRINITY_DN11630_c0_g1_i1.p1 TRINITY_DN11630_c0_g1~~TRINITY_DN11630_c0_g1_i1.p1  ORF type:complete len:269 (-),score=87.14 TRINITY_DN11630_c0_g1_i1:49-855(-)
MQTKTRMKKSEKFIELESLDSCEEGSGETINKTTNNNEVMIKNARLNQKADPVPTVDTGEEVALLPKSRKKSQKQSAALSRMLKKNPNMVLLDDGSVVDITQYGGPSGGDDFFGFSKLEEDKSDEKEDKKEDKKEEKIEEESFEEIDTLVKIDGTTFLKYVVEESDSLVGICLKFKLKKAVVKKINKIFSDDQIKAVNFLLLPYNAELMGDYAPLEETGKENLITQFIIHAKVSRDEALVYLETNDYNLEQALSEWKEDIEFEKQHKS